MSKSSAFRITDLISPGPRHNSLHHQNSKSLTMAPVGSETTALLNNSSQHQPAHKLIFDACLFNSMIMQNLSHNLFAEINPSFISNKAYECLGDTDKDIYTGDFKPSVDQTMFRSDTNQKGDFKF